LTSFIKMVKYCFCFKQNDHIRFIIARCSWTPLLVSNFSHLHGYLYFQLVCKFLENRNQVLNITVLSTGPIQTRCSRILVGWFALDLCSDWNGKPHTVV
jgi:hypothetical protein